MKQQDSMELNIKDLLQQIDSIALEEAMFGVAEFITWSIQLRKDLITIRELITTYLQKKVCKRPLNIMIAAEPGAGKSFLAAQLCQAVKDRMEASQIAKDEVVAPDSGNDRQTTIINNFRTIKVKLRFLEMNLSGLQEERDFTGIFDEVRNANLEGEVPFVFFDEIDAASEDIWHLFLTPMWDGVLKTHGRSHKLGRAIFVFATSKFGRRTISKKNEDRSDNWTNWKQSMESQFDSMIKKLDKDRDSTGFKVCDFMSRIDCIVYLPSLSTLHHLKNEQAVYSLNGTRYHTFLAHFETVYLAVAFILKHYPHGEVGQVEATALEKLAVFEFDSVRKLEQAVFIATPEKGQLLFDNLRPWSFGLQIWKKRPKSKMIAIARESKHLNKKKGCRVYPRKYDNLSDD